MPDMPFKSVSPLNFEVQWSNGQPLLNCTNEEAPTPPDLGAEDLASDTTETDESTVAVMSLQVTADSTFTSCQVFNDKGQTSPWNGTQRNISLEVGDEDREISFTIVAKTKSAPNPDPTSIIDGWTMQGPDQEGVYTWTLDPYVRLNRSSYRIKSNAPSPGAAARQPNPRP